MAGDIITDVPRKRNPLTEAREAAKRRGCVIPATDAVTEARRAAATTGGATEAMHPTPGLIDRSPRSDSLRPLCYPHEKTERPTPTREGSVNAPHCSGPAPQWQPRPPELRADEVKVMVAMHVQNCFGVANPCPMTWNTFRFGR